MPSPACLQVDSPEVQRIKTLIRYTEARSGAPLPQQPGHGMRAVLQAARCERTV